MDRYLLTSLTLLLVCGHGVFSGEDSNVEFDKPSFAVFHEFGKFEEGLSENTLPVVDQWVHRSGAWINFKATKNERMGLDALIGGIYWIPTKEEADRKSKIRFFAGSVPRFVVSYSWGDVENPVLKLSGGVFHYKYNKNARNLGEYMFRTGTYPGWVATGGLHYVGVNAAQLTGLKLTHNASDMFTHNLILNLETQIIPNYDIHISYMANLNLAGVLQIGAGLQLARILPGRPSKTNPDVDNNRYFTYGGKDYVDRKEWYQTQEDWYRNNTLDSTIIDSVWTLKKELDRSTADATDTASYIQYYNLHKDLPSMQPTNTLFLLDSISDSLVPIPSYENFKASGIKPVGYIAFDIKKLFGGDIWGENDFILYGEAAVLGIQNQPVIYDKLSERVPIMIGFNVPTFKLLDYLTIEGEWYFSKQPNSIRFVQNSTTPQPTLPPSGGYNPEDWTEDDTKWSVYAEKQIIDGFSLSGLVARDHARGWLYPTGKADWTFFTKKSHWYWMCKLMVKI
jgi:hypothetical protein